MPVVDVKALSKDGARPGELLEAINKGGYFIHNDSAPWNLVVIEEGMQSGDPSILLWIRTSDGVICLQTSLKAWRVASVTACAMAEAQFGWDGSKED